MMPAGDEAWRLDLARVTGGPRAAAPWKIAAWSVLLMVAFPAGLVAAWSGPFDWTLAATPLLIIAWVAASIYAVVVTMRFFTRRAWGGAIASMILPASACVAALWFGTLWRLAITAGDDIHFQMAKASYERIIAATPRSPFRLAIFDWGGLGVSHGVVYDESDQVLLPPSKRAQEWRARAVGTPLECGVSGYAVEAHFYIVRVGC